MVSIWINLVLIPWGNTWDLEVVPLLVLGAYRVQTMGSLMNRMQALSIQAALIYVSPWRLEFIVPMTD